MLAQAQRVGCCYGDRKPCAYHEGYVDGLDMALSWEAKR